jgi:nucleoside-diphosphate-sugar epimerase
MGMLPSRFKIMLNARVLITGASGFIGGAVAQSMAPKHRIHVLLRSSPATGDPLAKYQVSIGDIRDSASVHAAVQAADIVIHCAAKVSDWGGAQDFKDTNILGTANVVDACLKHRVSRLVHISTTDVYGYPDQAVNETAPLRPCGMLYPDTKIEAEKIVWRAGSLGLQISVVRPASVIGPGSRSLVLDFLPVLDQGLIPDFAAPQAKAGLTNVSNTADAISRIATSSSAINQAYNIHDGFPIRWADYLMDLARISGRKAKVFRVPKNSMLWMATFSEQTNLWLSLKKRPTLTRMAVQLLGTEQSFDTQKFDHSFARSNFVSYDQTLIEIEHWLATGACI